jgi:hypothetical protein
MGDGIGTVWPSFKRW